MEESEEIKKCLNCGGEVQLDDHEVGRDEYKCITCNCTSSILLKGVYTSFWRRFSALCIDMIIFIPLLAVNTIGMKYSRLFYIYLYLPNTIIALWYHIYLVGKNGGTPGKLLRKMKIVMRDGSAVTYKAAAIRYFTFSAFSLVSSIFLVMALLKIDDMTYNSLSYVARSKKLMEYYPLYNWCYVLGNIWFSADAIVMLSNKKRRALHDYLAGTVVVLEEKSCRSD